MFALTILGATIRVTDVLSDYSAYRKDIIKEDDLLVRKKLETEILKSQEHARNIQELLYEKGNKDGLKGLKKIKDEMDVFCGEISLASMGHQYSFFSIQRGRTPSEADLRTLVQFDMDILESIINMTESMTLIESHIMDGTDLDYNTEFTKLRQYATKSRNRFKDREDFLRGWK